MDGAAAVVALVRRAAALRAVWALPDDAPAVAEYCFDSSFAIGQGHRRWCNWLVPGRLLLGQYPHCQPADPGPSAAEAKAHLRALLGAGVDGFVSMQAETPPQDNSAAWPAGGAKLPLHTADNPARFPGTFVRYAGELDAQSAAAGTVPAAHYRCPIDDLAVPSRGALLALLSQMLGHFESQLLLGGGGVLYLHCWGGRGRAGLVGGCLLSLLRPEMSDDNVLASVQV